MAYRDHAPVGVTCPMIDQVIDKLTRLMQSEQALERYELDDLEKTLNKIRNHNAELRQWGNDLYKETQEAEVRISNLEGELETLKQDLNDLKDENADLSSSLLAL